MGNHEFQISLNDPVLMFARIIEEANSTAGMIFDTEMCLAMMNALGDPLEACDFEAIRLVDYDLLNRYGVLEEALDVILEDDTNTEDRIENINERLRRFPR